jgi:hypothetical protein
MKVLNEGISGHMKNILIFKIKLCPKKFTHSLHLGGATHLTIQSKDFARSGALQRRDKAAHVVVVQDIRHVHLPNLNREQKYETRQYS